VGIGVTTPTAKLQVAGPIQASGEVRGAAGNALFTNDGNGGQMLVRSTVGADKVRVGVNANGGGQIQLINNAGVVKVTVDDGGLTAPVLRILGGSDLAEPFAVCRSQNNDTQVAPGMVVVIDPSGVGRLKLARQPYDTKVAGVISGANELKPG